VKAKVARYLLLRGFAMDFLALPLGSVLAERLPAVPRVDVRACSLRVLDVGEEALSVDFALERLAALLRLGAVARSVAPLVAFAGGVD
jgi:hypothetical protein